MKIDEIFDQVSARMRADFERTRKAIHHRGLKGSGVENVVRAFLRDYLPQSLDLSTGLVVDSKGGVSNQLDIIVSDAAKTPIFYIDHGLKL